jgi:predicted transglutaminase-like cysteine proteinase
MNEMPLIKAVLREVHRNFLYTFDHDQFEAPEHWTSHADAVERGDVFRDDCDGFAMTCAELLIRKGADPERVRIATCWAETGEYHAVCVAYGRLMDNRYRAPHPWDGVGYKWHKSMRLSEPGEWRDAS